MRTETQIKPVTWHSINRHKFFDEARLATIQDQYTVTDLRRMLKNWTWEAVINATISGRHSNGVHFHGRIGRFMMHPAIAVCALNKIAVLRYVVTTRGSFTDASIITGEMGAGFALMHSDFQGRIQNVKVTDPVIGGDE
jgi:hypothetical protein